MFVLSDYCAKRQEQISPVTFSGDTKMLEEMKSLAREKNICVLATIVDRKPYCSLMAYVTNTACTEIYMVTHRQTPEFGFKSGCQSHDRYSRHIAPRGRKGHDH